MERCLLNTCICLWIYQRNLIFSNIISFLRIKTKLFSERLFIAVPPFPSLSPPPYPPFTYFFSKFLVFFFASSETSLFLQKHGSFSNYPPPPPLLLSTLEKLVFTLYVLSERLFPGMSKYPLILHGLTINHTHRLVRQLIINKMVDFLSS